MNLTDNSFAVIKTVNANDLVTTRLIGGTNNVWTSADRWVIAPFVGTLERVTTSAYGVLATTVQEEVLCIARSTDTLTISSTGRGYNGTTATTWAATDYMRLNVTSPIVERLKDLVAETAKQQDADRTTLATAVTNVGTLQDGTYHYVVTTGSANAYVAATPALAAYTAGNLVVMKANFSNTGAATVNLNGLGAKSIKKNDGATALAANDIISGQIVLLRYDGTNFQMLSPAGTPASITQYVKTVYSSGTSSTTLTNPTSATAFDTHTFTIAANDLANGVDFEWVAHLLIVRGTTSTVKFAVRTDGTDRLTLDVASLGASTTYLTVRGRIVGTAAAGGSVAVRFFIDGINDETPGNPGTDYATANLATNGALVVAWSGYFGSSNAGNNITVLSAKATKCSTSAFA